MKDFHRIEINGRVLCVSFRSSYQGAADYLVSHRGENEGRVTVIQNDRRPDERVIRDESDAYRADRWLKDHGFPWADACAAVRQALREQFDSDVREIVARGWLDGADEAIIHRAQELHLIPSQGGEEGAQ